MSTMGATTALPPPHPPLHWLELLKSLVLTCLKLISFCKPTVLVSSRESTWIHLLRSNELQISMSIKSLSFSIFCLFLWMGSPPHPTSLPGSGILLPQLPRPKKIVSPLNCLSSARSRCPLKNLHPGQHQNGYLHPGGPTSQTASTRPALPSAGQSHGSRTASETASYPRTCFHPPFL